MEVVFTRLPDRQEVVLFANMIVGTTPLPNMKAIGVIVSGGGTIPVEGTIEETLMKIRAAKSAPVNLGEDKNGISKRKQATRRRNKGSGKAD